MRRGRPYSSEPRKQLVSVYFSDNEMSFLDKVRSSNSRAAFIRATLLGHQPIVIPAINARQWAELARIAGNLNQFQRAVNAGACTSIPADLFYQLEDVLGEIRKTIIGGAHESKNQSR